MRTSLFTCHPALCDVLHSCAEQLQNKLLLFSFCIILNGCICYNLKYMISLYKCLQFNLTMSKKSAVKILILWYWNVYIKVLYCACFYNMNVVTKDAIYYHVKCVCAVIWGISGLVITPIKTTLSVFYTDMSKGINWYWIKTHKILPMFNFKVFIKVLQTHTLNQCIAWWKSPKGLWMSLL